MLAVDTNIVVRYVVGDHPEQSRTARALLGCETVFVARTVIVEAEWVLRSLYRVPGRKAIAALRAFAGLPSVTIEDAPLVARAFDWSEKGLDFADALHLAAASKCERFATFDVSIARKAERMAVGKMRLLA